MVPAAPQRRPPIGPTCEPPPLLGRPPIERISLTDITTPESTTPEPAPESVPEPTPVATPTFADFDVHPDIVASLAQAGIVTPFPIQAMTLPVALSGHDIIGQAKTGTGKTLGFGVPALHRVVSPGMPGYDELGEAAGKPQAIIVAPTRELAVQVAGDLEVAAKKTS